MTEEQVFLAALDLPDETARGTYLDETCGADARLRQQVEALLAAHFQSGEFLDVPAPEQISVEPALSHAVTIQSDIMPVNQVPDDDWGSLEFLAPPTREGSLGRIDHYEVLQVLGKGGFGIVFRAFDDVLQRVVAIKVMAPQLAATSPARKRFLREARTSAQVRHENVVQVYEVGEKPLPYLVMEFIPGETLQQRLDRVGPLDVLETLRIGRQIAEGLAAAHAMDLIHRDIKPGNVLLEGGQQKVKITDFGLARTADDASVTQSGQIAGTPMYMAPEQVLGHMLDQRADLFSLGTVLYQMAAGRPPFRATTAVAVLKRVAEDTPRNIREVIPETPQWLCDIIAKLHAKNPDERYQSARDVADVLADCEEQLKTNSRLQDFSRIPRGSSAARRSRRRKWAALAAVVVLFSAIALAQLEFAGVTHLFRGKATTDPIQAGEPTPIQVTKLGGPESDGWVQLFNGKDLTGWKFHPDHPGNWEVRDGILRGSKRPSHLFSERGGYGNFHLRAEVKINLGGDSGIMFRAPFELRRGRTPREFGVPGCYEAELHKNRSHALPTGSISETTGDAPPTSLGRVLDSSLTEPDEWFTYEVIAENNHFITKINGSEAANCNDPQGRHQTGHLALQVWHANTLVQFRKIEIKELPASPPATDGFVSLFNGKDLTGWKTHSLSGGEWKVENGAIDGRGTTSYLFSESGDYADFHLRVEAKINGNGDAGVYIRTPFDVQGLPTTGPAKFALLAGYEAAIALRANYPTHTGSLTAADGSTLHTGPLMPHEPDEWFVLEMIAEDNHIRTLVDGKPAADYHDENRRSTRGHIALQTWGPNITRVQFRKVEIRELPLSPSPAANTPPLAVTPFTAADVKRIAALSAEQQVAAVVASLKERNPGLNGTASHKIVDGVVTEFNFNPTDDQNALTDLSPVRALAGLTSLNLWNCSAVADLGPLQGLPLTKLLIGSLDVSNQVRDLKPLQGMKLTELHLYQCQVEDLQPLAGMPLIRLRVFSRQVRDCAPLKEMPLTTLDLSYCSQIQDFTPLTGLRLTVLHLNACQIRDLQPLLGLKLTEVSLAGTRVRDLQQLKGMPLKKLAIHRTGVTDLTPLQGMELKEIFLTPKNITQGVNHLRDMQSLHTIGIGYASTEKWPAAEFWDRYDKEEFALVPFTEADVQRIAALPAAQQVEEVRKELMRLNPGFDGNLKPTIEDGVVTELSINTDEILDISPVRALTGLVYLDCRGTYPNKGKFSDLSPLAGTTISRLDCSSTQVGDLTPLAGSPLTYLHFNHNPVSDLAPLKGMPLQELGIAETKVSDLSPLKGMQLKKLGAQLLPVTDLSPLAGMPLTGLDLYHTVGVTSLEPLRGMPLDGLNLQDVPVSDLSPLRGMTTLRTLLLQGCKVTDLSPLAGLKLTDLLMQDKHITDLSPLKGMPLTRLTIEGTGVSDLRPLQGMPLVEIRLNPKNITQGLDVLREIKTLQTIGIDGNQAWPPAEFWERLDKGEFK